MYTVTADYFATGEGRTLMVLITPGYGSGTGEENARAEFAQIFSSYMAMGCEVHSGIKLDFSGSEYLITDTLKTALSEWKANLRYHSSFHFNFS